MKKPFNQRPLCFERLEKRLALSTTTSADYAFNVDTFTVEQGGFVAFSDRGIAVHLSQFVSDQTFGRSEDELTLIIRGKAIYLNGVTGVTEAVGNFGFDGPSALVAPIAQPQTGLGDLHQGMVSLAEIFRPTTPKSTSRMVIAEPIVEPTRAASADTSWKSLVIAQARDVYFEVAGREERAVIQRDNVDILSEERLERVEIRKPVSAGEPDAAPAETEPASDSEKVTAVPRGEMSDGELLTHDEVSHADKEISADNEVENTPTEDHVSYSGRRFSDAVARDRAFADWRRSEMEEVLAVDNTKTDEHSATWPVLTAVFGGGWLIKVRNNKRRNQSLIGQRSSISQDYRQSRYRTSWMRLP